MGKEKHFCKSYFDSFSSKPESWVCAANPYGLEVYDELNDNVSYLEVSYCPFCGKSIEDVHGKATQHI